MNQPVNFLLDVSSRAARFQDKMDFPKDPEIVNNDQQDFGATVSRNHVVDFISSACDFTYVHNSIATKRERCAS